MMILLSKNSHELIDTILSQSNVKKFTPITNLYLFKEGLKSGQSSLDSSILIKLINAYRKGSEQCPSELSFLVESLVASLLLDLTSHLGNVSEKSGKFSKDASAENSGLKFLFLAVVGTIFAACEGFDGITALLEIFSLPAMAVFAGGVVFSLLSVIVFYAFDLVEISHNLGVKLRNVPQMLDIYIEQYQHIKAIRKLINEFDLYSLTIKKREEYSQLLASLQGHLTLLEENAEYLGQQEKQFGITIAKYFIASGAGTIFFSCGFFAGQTVALKLAFFLVAASISPISWPIVAVGLAVGFAALGIYWFVQRPGIEKLVSRWCGLDQEQIAYLAKKAKDEKEKLSKLAFKLAPKDSGNHLTPKLGDITSTELEVRQSALTDHKGKATVMQTSPRGDNSVHFFKPTPTKTPSLFQPAEVAGEFVSLG